MDSIVYQRGPYTVRPAIFGSSKGYAVFKEGIASHRCAAIGRTGPEGIRLAIAEIDRRMAKDAAMAPA